ncbi:MAG: carboxypeptidase regulatory-like domain-containing protein, partial [Gemmatimonas sp.]
GGVQARVSSSSGQPLGEVTVRLQQSDGSYPRASRSDGRGDVRFAFIQPGVYSLEARLIGYRPLTVSAVIVRATETTRLALVLEPSPTELTPVTVSASKVTINRTTTEFTSSLGAREREMLPTARNTNDLIAFTPGSRPGQIFGGSTNQANLYQLDGVTVNAPGTGGSFLLPNVDWLEDFKVIALGAGAEYGNFQGGLINMVTKSGNNTMQGAVRAFAESRAFNASNVNAFENGSEQSSRQELNAEVRGPLIRNTLYFFLSGQESLASQRLVDFRSTTRGRIAWLPTTIDRHEQKYYGKLTWQATPRDIINASLGLDNLSRERVGLNGYDDIDATARGRSPATFYQANWQRTLGEKSFLEVKFSGYNGADDQLPYHGSGQPSIRLLDVSGTPQYVNGIWTRKNSPDTKSLAVNFDRYVNMGGVQHQLRLGGDFGVGDWREQRTRNGGVSWYTQPRAGSTFAPLDAQTWGPIPSVGGGVYATADTGGSVDLNARSTNSALYLQDYIRVSDRITINAGVRAGSWTGSITPGHGGGSRGTETFTAVKAAGVDPRVGATIDLTGKGTLVAKAHWGRYHQNLFALFFDRAPGANAFTQVGFCDWKVNNASRPDPSRAYGASELATLATCRPGNSIFNEAKGFENYRQPYMDQVTVGLEKSLTSRLKAEVLYITRANKSILALVDRNAEKNWRPLRDVHVYDGFGKVLDANGQPLIIPELYVRADDLRRRLVFGTQFSNQIPGYTQADTLTMPTTYVQDLVITPVDEASRQFQQVQVGLTGDFATWSFTASVVRTVLEGNVFSVNGYFNPDGQDNGPFVEPNRALNYNGPLDNYSPWDLKARATGRLKWQLEGGAFFTMRTGDRWTPTYTLAREPNYRMFSASGEELTLNRDVLTGVSGQQMFIESRGSRQLPTQVSLDLRMQRVIPVRGNEMLVGIELFNVFNGQAASEVKTSVNNQINGDQTSLAGAVRVRQQPLTLRLSTQFRF